MSVSSLGSISAPDPGFYSVGSNGPAGLDTLNAPVEATPPTAAATTPSPSTTTGSASITPLQAEYNLLQKEDTQELLTASFESPTDSLANADSVFQQVAAIQDSQLAAQQQQNLANAQAAIDGSSSSSTTSSTLSTADASNLPTLQDLFDSSDAAAQTALNNYSNAPAGSSIIDYQA
jgi:hypothetical protein